MVGDAASLMSNESWKPRLVHLRKFLSRNLMSENPELEEIGCEWQQMPM